MAINDAIIGLQKTVDVLTAADVRLRQNTEQFTGQPFPNPVGNNKILNRKPLIWQIRDIPNKYQLPDLTMSINPQSLSSDYKQLLNRKRTIGGFVEEHWGEELDTLSSSGRTATFYGPLGLTNYARRDTQGFLEFQKFVNIYRNNGTLFDEKTSLIVAQGSVILNYDSAVYRGYFESLSITESGDKPFDLQYEFSFKITQELYPGRMKSFRNVTTVTQPGVLRNDRVTLDIVGLQTTQG
jgi:hypothetical protein